MLQGLPSDMGAWHPLVIHFPIALLLVVPIFLFASLFSRQDNPPMRTSALLLLALGVLGTWVAIWTGEQAAIAARLVVPGAATAIHEHEESAEAVAGIFTFLLVVFAIRIAWASRRKDRLPRQPLNVFCVVFLVVYCACSLVVIDAAHRGGKLVHALGLRAGMTRPLPPPRPAPIP